MNTQYIGMENHKIFAVTDLRDADPDQNFIRPEEVGHAAYSRIFC